MRYVLGIFVIATGVVMLLNNLGLAEIEIGELIRIYWPVVLLIWGFKFFLNSVIRDDSFGKKSGGAFGEILTGVIIIIVGGVLLFKNLGWVTVNLSVFWKAFWPTILIIVGLTFLTGKSGLKGKNQVAFMGGIELGKSSQWELKSDSFWAFMGGVNLDLTNAKIPEGETVLDLTAVMGGFEVIVPPNIPVICDGMALLGGIEFLGEGTGGIIANKTMSANIIDGAVSVIRIKARAVMGGIEVKRG